jgi:ABC-type glycerol-3-phosphate transport system substrate-binding protein
MKNRFLALTLTALMFTGCGSNSSSSTISDKSEIVMASSETNSNPADNEPVVITIAASASDKEMSEQIKQFNSENNGYRIEMKDYSLHDYEQEDFAGRTPEQLQYADLPLIQDIINSDDIDIVCKGSFYNSLSYESLKSKGAFEDLYSFMKDDNDVNTAQLNEHILKLNESDGKLYSFPTYYCIETLYGETRYVGDKENWTFDELIEHWHNMPEGSTFSGSNEANRVCGILLNGNLDKFVDSNSHEVRFDSDEFRRILEFLKEFLASRDEYISADYSTPCFITPYLMEGIISANIFDKNNGDHTLVGFPSDNEAGAYGVDAGRRFSICSKSSKEKQIAAWSFIRRFYTYDYQKNNALQFVENYKGSKKVFERETGYCLNNKAFEDVAQDIIAGKYYDFITEINPDKAPAIPTQENYNELLRYISNIQKWKTITDNSISLVINEEINAYLSEGQDVSTTVDVLQDRISTLINE